MAIANFENMLPRQVVLKFPDRVTYRRPTAVTGSLAYPKGISLVQVTWAGDASILVNIDTGRATLAGPWVGKFERAKDGRYPIQTISAETAGSLVVQGMHISEADLNRHLGVVITPIAPQ